MKGRSKAGGKPAKTRRRKTVTPRRGNAPKGGRRAKSSATILENKRKLQARELREAREERTAIEDVLRIISSSPGALEPVFKAILENAARICEAKFGVLFRFDGENYEFAADIGTPPPLAHFVRQRGPFIPAPNSQLHHVMRTKRVSNTADYAADAPESPPLGSAAPDLLLTCRCSKTGVL